MVAQVHKQRQEQQPGVPASSMRCPGKEAEDPGDQKTTAIVALVHRTKFTFLFRGFDITLISCGIERYILKEELRESNYRNDAGSGFIFNTCFLCSFSHLAILVRICLLLCSQSV
ncbi:hypothetical protein [Massilia niastensis]|uniref:hypothetical protein n=1 Tax=Massilia niastensis TaxID=544911 RepID=UPI0012EC54B2|nr:hypothetical protein [Massilia niastensis]